MYLRVGEIIAPNMLSWLKLWIKLLFLHLVGCLYYCISDARSHKHQIQSYSMTYFEGRIVYQHGPNIRYSVDTCFMNIILLKTSLLGWRPLGDQQVLYHCLWFPLQRIRKQNEKSAYSLLVYAYGVLFLALAMGTPYPEKPNTKGTTLLPRWLNTNCFHICWGAHNAKASPLPQHRRRCSAGTGDNCEAT